MTTHKLFRAVINHDFAENTCFLCGCLIGSDNGTNEHVFPKWLLQRFNLWNSTIHLLNGTRIPYRQLVIPCCNRCNNEHLSSIEAEVEENFAIGASALQKMDRERLMLWTTKIFYGLVYRELFLTLDRKKAELGNIISAEDMEQFQLIHYILQAARIPFQFNSLECDIPCTLFVFEVKDPGNPLVRFDYKDDFINRTLYLRMGHVGVLAAFDMGAQNYEGELFFPKYQGKPLHPVQFEELGAYLFMKARKLNRTPKVMFVESPDGVQFDVLPIAGLSMTPVFDDIKPEEMAEAKMFFLGYPKESVMSSEGLVATWLHREDGTFWDMEMNFPPWVMTE